MERSHHLFIQGEQDNVPALDDLLSCHERLADNDWNFKHEFLPSDEPHFVDLGTSGGADARNQTLYRASYADEEYSRCEKEESESSFARNKSLEFKHVSSGPSEKDMGNQALPCSVNIFSSSASESAESAFCDAGQEMMSLSGNRCGGNPGSSDRYAKHYSRIGTISEDLGVKIRFYLSRYGFGCGIVKRSGCARLPGRREVQKPPTTSGIGLDDLKDVFHFKRPSAEKKLLLKRTTFSNLSRHYGISKWPFRTIRDVVNRWEANERILIDKNLSKSRRRKLEEQQRHLAEVIHLIYSDPGESRDSNTLAVLLRGVAQKTTPTTT